MILSQGPQFEGNVGALVKIRLQEPSRYTGEITETAVYIGGWYRFSDAFILNARLDWMNFALGLSYDINISKINVATESRGGFEISLMYIQPFKASRKTATPLM
ncbi:MAG TPA: type IX secretion system membrane protein PorP/SprF [Phycisphaerales bacterium]|nr:type IX secretion system membrane protein PorP/SprF [Phycisphaerales bacterium]